MIDNFGEFIVHNRPLSYYIFTMDLKLFLRHGL